MRNYVKTCRVAAGLTLAQLARKSGIPASTISEIEHGAEPRVMTAIYIARALEFTVEELWPVQMGGVR